MDEEILMMWKNHTGIVSFSHHSTWFGYTKIWLPILLGSMGYKSSAALFVDTDTVWNDSPSAIFDELINFNSTQVFGATSIVNRHKFANSLSFRNRITSGILLMDLGGIQQIDWVGIVRESVASNRGVDAQAPIPIEYNQSAYCESFHWGDSWSLPFCLTEPYFNKWGNQDCSLSRTCWKTGTQSGDQEFFSNVFSNFQPELLFELPRKHQYTRMGSLVPNESASRNVSSTLLHIPAIAQLWGKEEMVKDDELINILPLVALESVRWFRKHAQNITY
jgi:hypothetical protein